ncbi:hypothetical protein [Cedecea neteri]|uniref:hypothetical protein n=1 Tax=Cedecea neteri TaxID=158822 RepID=UPI00289F69A4|nr:hypothetical protein [Cedecea neteri]
MAFLFVVVFLPSIKQQKRHRIQLSTIKKASLFLIDEFKAIKNGKSAFIIGKSDG